MRHTSQLAIAAQHSALLCATVADFAADSFVHFPSQFDRPDIRIQLMFFTRIATTQDSA
jgi:hypothetical protein